jgi:UDP-2,4-diacetamido-2,4,6-trideoxy-beta-L-altropyranose hydrolase
VNILFRVDGSTEIGGGHVMRCITIAQKFKKLGAICIFICKAHEGNYTTQIRELGFIVFVLPLNLTTINDNPLFIKRECSYDQWLGSDWLFDANQTILNIKNIKSECLIIDHYAIDSLWEQRLRPYVPTIIVIDDLANRAHVCDLLLDQSLGREKRDYANIVNSECKILIGPKYALLREEFYKTRCEPLSKNKNRNTIEVLVAMGAMDKDNLTEIIIDKIISAPFFNQVNMTLVLGLNAPWISSIMSRIRGLSNVKLLVHPLNIAKLMANSDVAITAGGGTSLEICCMGLPGLVIITADNQTNSAYSLSAMGAIELIDKTRISIDLIKQLDFLINNSLKRQAMSNNACAIIDGKGCDRVFREINALLSR